MQGQITPPSQDRPFRATSKKYAERLLVPLAVADVDSLRKLTVEHRRYLADLFRGGLWEPSYVNANEIGTK